LAQGGRGLDLLPGPLLERIRPHQVEVVHRPAPQDRVGRTEPPALLVRIRQIPVKRGPERIHHALPRVARCKAL
jgi:hypothetical protein